MIAYYAHSIGSGHSNCGQEFCKAFNDKALIITTIDFSFDKDVKVIKIEGEDVDHSEYLKSSYNLPTYAHYLPKSESKLLSRNFKILETCISENINFAIIDVSVETAIQFRIAGIPYAYHKMLGNRDDLPHQMAYEASEFLFALYPAVMESVTKSSTIEKTHYLGFISRFKFREEPLNCNLRLNHSLNILIILSSDSNLSSQDIFEIAKQMPMYQFTVIGQFKANQINNVSNIEYTRNIADIILNHHIVIASCGLNMTSELLALKNKFIAVVEDRCYNEHIEMMKGLKRNNLAVELDVTNFKKTISDYLNLPKVENLKSYFGSMKDFKTIKEIKQFL
jgi:UDP-N-acetylglucosamine transferase subunit ALG13